MSKKSELIPMIGQALKSPSEEGLILMEQAYSTTFKNILEKIVKEDGNRKFDSGFGIFEVVQDAKTQTANVVCTIKEEFIDRVDSSASTTPMVPDERFIKEFEEALKPNVVSDEYLAAGTATILAQSIADHLRSKSKNDKKYTLPIEGVGQFVAVFKEGEPTSVTFECEEHIKQIVKNFK